MPRNRTKWTWSRGISMAGLLAAVLLLAGAVSAVPEAGAAEVALADLEEPGTDLEELAEPVPAKESMVPDGCELGKIDLSSSSYCGGFCHPDGSFGACLDPSTGLQVLCECTSGTWECPGTDD